MQAQGGPSRAELWGGEVGGRGPQQNRHLSRCSLQQEAFVLKLKVEFGFMSEQEVGVEANFWNVHAPKKSPKATKLHTGHANALRSQVSARKRIGADIQNGSSRDGPTLPDPIDKMRSHRWPNIHILVQKCCLQVSRLHRFVLVAASARPELRFVRDRLTDTFTE